jgi:hypothetical protein
MQSFIGLVFALLKAAFPPDYYFLDSHALLSPF